MSDASRWKATVFVGGLPSVATTANIRDAFIPFGDIVDVQIPKPDSRSSTDTHRGFAYVEYEDSADAQEAIDNMDRSEFFGRILKVSPAKAPKSATEGLGSKKAVWEQEDWLLKNVVDQANGAPESQEKSTEPPTLDPMQGLEGLDVAGPKPA